MARWKKETYRDEMVKALKERIAKMMEEDPMSQETEDRIELLQRELAFFLHDSPRRYGPG